MNNIHTDFRKYALSNGVHGSALDSYDKQVANLMTPYILEERQLNVSTLDVFSRLMLNKILYFTGEVTQDSCSIAIAQLLYLESLNNGQPINCYITSPGGSCIAGLALCDTMKYIKTPVHTTCIGMAASMGAVILSCGEKGNRGLLQNSTVMIHSVSSTLGGPGVHSNDIRIEMKEMEKTEDKLFHILAENCGKSYDEIKADCERDKWLWGQEAVDYGICDKVLVPNN